MSYKQNHTCIVSRQKSLKDILPDLSIGELMTQTISPLTRYYVFEKKIESQLSAEKEI